MTENDLSPRSPETPEESATGSQSPPSPQLPPPPFSSDLPPVEPERDGPAWEWRQRLGFFRALTTTIREVLLKPEETFRQARRQGGLGAPLGFFLLMGLGVALLHFLLIDIPFTRLSAGYMSRVMEINRNLGSQYAQLQSYLNHPPLHLQLIGLVTIVPLGLIFSIFIISGLVHLLLKLVGGARYPFEATFRTAAYTGGACALIGLIPLCGGTIQQIVWMNLMIIGLVRMHETDTWRAVFAVLAPVVLMLLLIVLFAVFIVSFISILYTA